MKANHNLLCRLRDDRTTMVNIGMSKNESKSQRESANYLPQVNYGKYRHVKE